MWDEFHPLAFRLLGIDYVPSPRFDGYEGDPYLTDREYQTLCNIVCERLPWITAAEWWEATEGQRIACMEAALRLQGTTGGGADTQPECDRLPDPNVEAAAPEDVEVPDLPTTPRLTVDLVGETLTLDRVTYDVSSPTALRWIKVLAEHPGEWISAEELHDRDSELMKPRTHELKKYLPQPVLDLIESKTGRGSRIRPNPSRLTTA